MLRQLTQLPQLMVLRLNQLIQSKIGSYHRYEQGTTLCHYMRVCLVWGPLLIAFWGAIASVICMLLYAAEAQGWRSAIKLGLPPWFGLLFFQRVSQRLLLLRRLRCSLC